MKRIFSTALVLASAFIVNADTHTWKTSPEVDYSDWDNSASYVEGSKPEEGDIVILPSNGETVYLSDSDMSSFELASKLAQIKPVHSWSVTGRVVFTISNPMSSLKFNSMITYDPDSKSALQPIIVKKGAGELELANATKGSAYRADIYVDEGILKLSQGSTGGTLTVGDLSVSNGATFFTANCGFTVCDRLYCDGLIANTSDNWCTRRPFAFCLPTPLFVFASWG